MKIITRREARGQGLKRYFTGVACPHGHITQRATLNGTCVECARLNAARGRVRRPTYYDDWLEKNPTHHSMYYSLNKGAYSLRSKLWTKANSGKKAASCAKRRAGLLQAIPPWASLQAIRLFYENCPKGHHVDHIIPLNHPRICGLHVLENLQYLTAEANMVKGNKFTPQ